MLFTTFYSEVMCYDSWHFRKGRKESSEGREIRVSKEYKETQNQQCWCARARTHTHTQLKNSLLKQWSRVIYLLSQVRWRCFPVQTVHWSRQFLNISHHTITDWIESDRNVNIFIHCLQAPVPHVHKLKMYKGNKSLLHLLLSLTNTITCGGNCLDFGSCFIKD